MNRSALETAITRSRGELAAGGTDGDPVRVGVADQSESEILVWLPEDERLATATAVGPASEECRPATIHVDKSGITHIQLEDALASIRYVDGQTVLGGSVRILVHNPKLLEHLKHTGRQLVLREALGALASETSDVARLISTVVGAAPELTRAPKLQ